MASPLVSITISTYNRAGIVPRAIHSAFAQTYPNIEVVAVDDGSTDATPALLDGYAMDPRVRVVRHPENRGTTALLAAGMALAPRALLRGVFERRYARSLKRAARPGQAMEQA